MTFLQIVFQFTTRSGLAGQGHTAPAARSDRAPRERRAGARDCPQLQRLSHDDFEAQALAVKAVMNAIPFFPYGKLGVRSEQIDPD